MKLNFHENHWLLLGTIFFGFLALSLIIGVGPAISVQADVEPLPTATVPTQLERDGLAVYIAEGCVACHTQQVRDLEMDRTFGRASVADDYAHTTPLGPWAPYAPAVLGSSRTGPDLANVGARQGSETWQAIHLYNPRAVVPDSIMPGYPWLFDEVATVPEGKTAVPLPPSHAPEGTNVVLNDKGEALVAYLLSLEQPPLEEDAAHVDTDEAARAAVRGETR